MKIIPPSLERSLISLKYTPIQAQEIKEYIIGTRNINNTPFVNREILISKGFSDVLINKINTSLPIVYSLHEAFSEYNLNHDIYQKFNVPNGKNILDYLGFSQEELNIVSNIVFGKGTITNAPHLKDEHYNVFACAAGDNPLHYQDHIKMMAATQPFISGAISKSVNLPQCASIKDIEESYKLAHKLGLKALAVYREHSKFSQPLSSGSEISLYTTLKDYIHEKKTELKRGEKEKLPNRLSCYRQKVSIGGYKVYLTVGLNKAGEIREIFVSGMGTEGTTVRSLMSSFVQAISIGLQYGVPIEAYINSFKFSKFDPSGFVNGHNTIKFATSLPDFIARELEQYIKRNHIHNTTHTTCDDNNLNHITYNVYDDNNENPSHNIEDIAFTGDICTNCNSATMKRIGTCLQCHTCYETTGCG